jgi:hypothetical protein
MLGVRDSMTWYSSSGTRLITKEVTKHETPPRCIVHGAIKVEENDFLENVCEEIVREGEIQCVILPFLSP